jgi:predicted ATP-grasp superfamily ATP-dependent carboligase
MVRARVLVSDGETPAALAVVRSLCRAGHRVHVLTSSRHAAAAASRCARVVRVPDATAQPGAFSARLLRILVVSGFDAFLPISDTALMLTDAIRDRIPARTALALPDSEALSLGMDKPAVLERAESLGIPVLPRRRGEAMLDAPLPAVVKPERSRILLPNRVGAATATVVEGRLSLMDAARRLEDQGFAAYVEPWIPGEGRGVFLLLHDNKVWASFAHRRIREAQPAGGPSAVAESVAMDPELLAWSTALALDLGVTGPFMAEYRGEPGEWVLLEVNARYWGSLALAIAAGVDFPALHLDAVLGRARTGPKGYDLGRRVRNLDFDLRRTAAVLAGRRGADGKRTGRCRALFDLLFTSEPGMIAEAGDPAPARAHLLSRFLKAVRRE